VKGEFTFDLSSALGTKDQDPLQLSLNDLNSELNARKTKLKMQLAESEREIMELLQLKQSYIQFFRNLKQMVKTDPSLILPRQ
jgi:hypothetical protein